MDGPNPTCVDFGPYRELPFPTNHFCDKHNRWDNLPVENKRLKQTMILYRCTANHTSFLHQTTLKKTRCCKIRSPMVPEENSVSTGDTNLVEESVVFTASEKDDEIKKLRTECIIYDLTASKLKVNVSTLKLNVKTSKLVIIKKEKEFKKMYHETVKVESDLNTLEIKFAKANSSSSSLHMEILNLRKQNHAYTKKIGTLKNNLLFLQDNEQLKKPESLSNTIMHSTKHLLSIFLVGYHQSALEKKLQRRVGT